MREAAALAWLLRAGCWAAVGLACVYLPTDPARAGVAVAIAFVLLLDSRLNGPREP